MSQLTFCGASVRGFSSTIGWNQQTSQFRCSVVEDHSNGDLFNPPIVGSPVYFIYGAFYFYGLLQRWTESNGISGLPTYEIECIDPRAILDGAPIITAGYRGAVPVSNTFNAFGWWENLTGFGSSLSNDAGMPWYKILQSVNVMANSLTGLYGSALRYRGVAYSLDLSELPVPPQYYRIPGPSISIMEAINLICEDGGCDYFVELEKYKIKIRTVSRLHQPPLGTITSLRLAGWGKDLISSTNGLEARNEVSSAFIIGGEQKNIFYNDSTGMQHYWGLDQNGLPILGSGVGYSHSMTLNSSSISFIVGTTSYQSTILEILCAMNSYSSWSSYMMTYNKGMAKSIGIALSFGPPQVPKPLFVNDLIADDKINVQQANQNFAGDGNARCSIVHDFIKKIGNDYLGKQYLVSIPFVLSAQEPETLRFIFSQEPTDGGYLPEGSAPLGLPLLMEDQFKTSDGRFRAFCLYGLSQSTLDVNPQGLNQNELFFSNNGVYVKCEVEPDIVFTPDPNVVIKINNPIFRQDTGTQGGGAALNFLQGVNAQADQNMQKNGAGGGFSMKVHGLPYDPELVAVPLKSNILTYGPWFLQGAQGKVRFEHDTSLTPWQYGGYKYMNAAANAKVVQAITFMQVSESGTHEEVGAPRFGLGNALQGIGPNITNIDVTYGDRGVSTRYTMQTFSPKPYGFSKDNAKRFERLGRQNAELRKNLIASTNNVIANDNANNNAYLGLLNNLPTSMQRKSPHPALFSCTQDDDYGTIRTVISTATFDEIKASNGGHLDDVWKRTAVMSLNGLLRPISTNFNAVGIAHYDTITSNFSSGPGINNINYNPFKNGHDLNEVACGQSYVGMNTYAWPIDDTDTRVMALRGPLVINGYGWTVDQKVVPGDDSGNPGPSYTSSFMKKSHLWKTGAVDMLWDDNRKVWTSHDILIGKTATSSSGAAIPARGSGVMNIYNGDAYTNWDLTVYNWFGTGISGDVKVMAGYCVTANKWYIMAADCPGV